MADTSRLEARFDTDEAHELRRYVAALGEQKPELAEELAGHRAAFDAAVAGSGPDDAEQAAEAFARAIRAAWLNTAGREASSVYRSPTAGETRRIARAHDGFGYERDLRPESLEERCTTFFPPPPSGWRQDHVLFSSGQSAMTATLLALTKQMAGSGDRLRLAHRGTYFETQQLVQQLPAFREATFAQTADIVINEPVACDGHFHRFDTEKLLSASPRVAIFDTTLIGRNDGIDSYLDNRPVGDGQLVLRVASCLKLMQGGLELANAGVVSVYTTGAEADFAEQLRTMRTLTGSGIHLVDAIALEAPWVFNAEDVDTYTSAVFAHNARLAQVVEENNKRFQPVTHPSLWGEHAPFCAFTLKEPSPEAYDALEAEIEREARRRNLNFVKGGSFGFRAHRFEVVRPETDDAPFLRIAMGRRNGWSCDGIIAMMSELAAR